MSYECGSGECLGTTTCLMTGSGELLGTTTCLMTVVVLNSLGLPHVL